MPVRSVADWGGLQEWALTAVLDLVAAGHEVVVAGGQGLFRTKILEAGADYIDVDWTRWEQAVDECLRRGPWDRIFSHGPLGSDLALKVGGLSGAPIYHMIHGSYLDNVNHWSPRVERILVSSPALLDFVVRVGFVEPWKVSVVPAGAPRWVFDLPAPSLEEKLQSGRPVVATAARLAADKVRQIEPTIALVREVSDCIDGRPVELLVMGDGPHRAQFEQRLRQSVPESVTVTIAGWVAHDQVPHVLNRALATCAAGMGAARALAAGALTLAVGAQGSVGLQRGRNLRAGLWSNFGDHGCPRFRPSDLSGDVRSALLEGTYDEDVRRARDACFYHRNEDRVRAELFDALDLEPAVPIDRAGA